jgi:glycerophosphoryl diester phosphodiesterase
VRAIEIDVGVLKDGSVVVHHDLALNPDLASLGGRYLTGSLPLLKDLTLEDLEDFDVGRIRPGSDYAARFPEQQAIEGQRIPTLSDTLALDEGVRWTIELKLQPDRPDWTVAADTMVERVLAVVDAAGAADRVMLQSFDWRAPRYLRRVRPDMACAWLTSADTLADAATWLDMPSPVWLPDAIVAEGGGTWAPFFSDLTEILLHRAQALGVPVVPWTVNKPADIARLASWGVDGMITDYPNRVPK